MPKVPIAKFPLEEILLVAGQALPNGAVSTFSSIFPVGKGSGETWDRIRLLFHVTLGVGVQTFPVESGVYNFIRRITLDNSDGETLVDCPGTALHIFNWYNDGHNPWHTPVAAAAAQYDAVLDIPFGFNFLRKPEDGYLDSGAYSRLTLTITTGPYAAGAVAGDLGVSNAGGTQVATVDISVIRTKAGMINDQTVKPLFVPWIKYIGSRVPSNTNTFFDVEISDDLCLFGFLLAHGTVARAPFDHVVAATGLTAEADTITAVSFGDNIIRSLIDNKQLLSFRVDREKYLDAVWPVSAIVVPNIPTVTSIGKYIHNFVKDGSIYGAYPTGGKSQVRCSYLGGGAGTNQVDMLAWGFRTLRRKA
jgi:hypothetical protein